VRTASDFPDADPNKSYAGKVYRYLGAPATLNLGAVTWQDLNNPLLWQDTSGSTTPQDVFPNFGNLANSDSRAIGAAVVTNAVTGNAEAFIERTAVAATSGDVTVLALSNATMLARYDSNVSSSGGSAWGTGDSLAVNVQSVTNLVNGSATARITDSTVTAGDDVRVEADNATVLDATLNTQTAAGQNAVTVALAFNSIGWDASNLLFNTVDTILGDPLISSALDGENPSKALAYIERTDVTATGDLSVVARSSELLNATLSNSTISAASAVTGADGKAIGISLASNKASGESRAWIDNAGAPAGTDIRTGAAVLVSARDDIRLFSNTKFVSQSSTSNDGGVNVLNETLNDRQEADYATNGASSQPVNLLFGDRVRLADTYGNGGLGGRIYVFMGTEALGAGTNLNAVDYTNTDLWKLSIDSDPAPVGFNVSDSDSMGVGALLVVNDLRSEVSAAIRDASVTTTNGNIDVLATGNALMSAKVDAATSASGGSLAGDGTVIAVGGVIATNVLQGGVRARVVDSMLSAATPAPWARAT
jgi:hypothetical protein